MIDVSLVTWLSGVSNFQVVEGVVSQDRVAPWLWFRRSSTVQERLLSGAPCNNFTTYVDLEFVSTDIDEVQTEADSVRQAIHAVAPGSTVGATFVHFMEVLEQADDYVYRTILQSDEGLHVASYQLRILHAE